MGVYADSSPRSPPRCVHINLSSEDLKTYPLTSPRSRDCHGGKRVTLGLNIMTTYLLESRIDDFLPQQLSALSQHLPPSRVCLCLCSLQVPCSSTPTSCPPFGTSPGSCLPSGGSAPGSRSPSHGDISSLRLASLCVAFRAYTLLCHVSWAPTPRALQR